MALKTNPWLKELEKRHPKAFFAVCLIIPVLVLAIGILLFCVAEDKSVPILMVAIGTLGVVSAVFTNKEMFCKAMKRKSIRLLTLAVSALMVLGVVFGALVWNGVIILNGLSAKKYPVRGIDVSGYQGEIDWQELAGEGISFAFIKATEGSGFVDRRFAYNFEEAQKTSLAVGAYHFFSYDSDGKTQGQNFINTVKPFQGMLPPVIDLEFYGDLENNPPKRADVEPQLKALLDMLEEHYGQKPIIYATEKSYKLYLSGGYKDYDIWIRNVISKPKLSDNREWTFWQYTNREKLKGYNGKEKYIDMNVFKVSAEEFNNYVSTRGYLSE